MSRKRFTFVLLLSTLFVLCLSVPAYASGIGMGSDATVDILGNNRFQGAVQWVNKFGQFVDQWFMAFISFISFFIISASCLRNVLAGAYCVFPKFWDKVDDAHKAGEAMKETGWYQRVQQFTTGGGWQNAGTGSITQFILRLLPNVKVLTDFENAQDPDYKQYFMRAIPQCVVAVFVGVFIYNGYYRDVMIVTSNFGSQLTMNALTSIKPDEILYKMSNISGIPTYPIKGATAGTDRIADAYLTEVAGYVRQKYPDQNEKENKERLYLQLSDRCSALFNTDTWKQYIDSNVWKVTVTGAGYTNTPSTSTSNGLSADGMTYTEQVWLDLSTVSMNTEYNKGETWYVYATVIMTNQGANADASNLEINDFVLTVGTPIASNTYTLPGGSYGGFKTGGSPTIGGKKVELTANTIKFPDGIDASDGQILQASGLFYASSDPNRDYTIQAVRFSSGKDTVLESTSTGISIKWGGSVQEAYNRLKNSGASVNTGQNNTTVDDDTDTDEDLGDGAK